MTDARAGGSKNRISDRRRNRGCGRLTQSDRGFRAGNKLNVNFRCFSHTKYSVAIEIRILRLPFGELGSFIQGHRNTPQSCALHLGCGAIRMNDRSGVDDKGQLFYHDVAIRAVDPHAELASMWRLSPATIRKLVRNEPGVLKLEGVGSAYGKRSYTTFSIPESVALRIHERLTQQPLQTQLPRRNPRRVVFLRNSHGRVAWQFRDILQRNTLRL
jgi:hypothetical protein